MKLLAAFKALQHAGVFYYEGSPIKTVDERKIRRLCKCADKRRIPKVRKTPPESKGNAHLSPQTPSDRPKYLLELFRAFQSLYALALKSDKTYLRLHKGVKKYKMGKKDMVILRHHVRKFGPEMIEASLPYYFRWAKGRKKLLSLEGFRNWTSHRNKKK